MEEARDEGGLRSRTAKGERRGENQQSQRDGERDKHQKLPFRRGDGGDELVEEGALVEASLELETPVLRAAGATHEPRRRYLALEPRSRHLALEPRSRHLAEGAVTQQVERLRTEGSLALGMDSEQTRGGQSAAEQYLLCWRRHADHALVGRGRARERDEHQELPHHLRMNKTNSPVFSHKIQLLYAISPRNKIFILGEGSILR